MKIAIVTGSSSGLGRAIMNGLVKTSQYQVMGIDQVVPDLNTGDAAFGHINYLGTRLCDLSSMVQIEEVFGNITAPVDLLVNNAGINYIDWMQNIPVMDWDRLMNVNARAIWLVTRALLPGLRETKGTVMNVVSNAMHIPMTHSIAYNASKGAAGIMTRQMARELQKEHGICVFGICPNKMAGTGMSKYIENRVCELRDWTPEEAEKYQLQALLAGKETEVYQIAELVCWLLEQKSRHNYLTGCLLELGL